MNEAAVSNDLTEWDSSKATLYRIDTALKMCSDAYLRDDYENWYDSLQILKREAIVKMRCACKEMPHKDDCERGKTVKLFLECSRLISPLITRQGKPTPSLITQLEKKLDETEVWLRDFMDGKGMLLRTAKTAMEKFRGR